MNTTARGREPWTVTPPLLYQGALREMILSSETRGITQRLQRGKA